MPATTSAAHTGNAYTDGLIYGTKWAVTTLTFSFPTSAAQYGSGYGSNEPASNFEAFNATQQTAVRATLAMYSAVANINFTEVTETTTAHGDFRYAMSDLPSTAWAYYPTTNVAGGDAWFNNSSGWYDNPITGTYAFVSVVHETGHGLGLKHPHEAAGTFAAMPADHDSLEYTVMSYRSYIGGSTSSGYVNAGDSYPQTLMMYDIAAVQALYGANYTTNATDTVYTWSPTTGQMFVNGAGQAMPVGNKIFRTVWDGGGNDTYDFSNYTTAISVNLQPGEWSTASSAQLANLGNNHKAAGNIANALLYNNNQASLIENAVGGSGADALVGNAGNNRFTGNAGNDTIDGQGGVNTSVYSGTHLQYAWTQVAGNIVVTDLRVVGGDGIDTLANIQYLQFSDGTYATSTAAPSNSAPVAQNDAYSTANAATLSVTAANGVLTNDSDPDGNPITAQLVSGPAHGTLSLASNGSFTYTPTSGWSGTDTFTYRANDGSANSANATVSVTTAAPVNRAPVAQNDAYSTANATKLTVTATNGLLKNDSDPDGNPITAQLVSGPAHGTLSLASDGSFTYTPASGWSGTDTFTYRANDASLNSANATVSIATAAPVNRAPVAQNDTYSTANATKLTVTTANGVLKNDSDPDGNPITAQLVGGPAHGTLSLASNGSFTYTPASGWSGTDTFTYRANDGSLKSANAIVSVTTATPANRAPVAANDAYSTANASALSVTAANGVLKNDTDPDGNPITAQLVSGPAHGTLSLASNGSFTYTPTSGWSGTDTFTYRANDGSLNSANATVSIATAAPVNRAPVAQADSYSTANGTLLSVAAASGVLSNDTDPDGNALTAALVIGPAHGTLTLSANGGFNYTPTVGWSGTDTFTYRANDGALNSANATVSIAVGAAANRAPVATADGYSTANGAMLAVAAAKGVLSNDSDPDGNPLTSVLATGPAHGTLSLAANGGFTYTPVAGWSGTDSFTYRASDGSLQSATTTVSLAVQPPSNNTPPAAGNDEYAVNYGFGQKLTVTAANGLLSNDSDADGNPLTVSLVAGPQSGTLQLSPDGSFTYTPSWLSSASSVTFQYRTSDGTAQSVVATVTIDIVRPFTTAPVIDKSIIVQNDTYSGVAGQVLSVDAAHGVLANDSDREGETLTASLVSGPANGSVSLAGDGSFVFTPTENFTGTTSFAYRATDGNGVSTNATATISVAASGAQTVASGSPAASATLTDGALDLDLDAIFALWLSRPTVHDVGAYLLAQLLDHQAGEPGFEAPDNMPAPAPDFAAILDPLHHHHDNVLV